MTLVRSPVPSCRAARRVAPPLLGLCTAVLLASGCALTAHGTAGAVDAADAASPDADVAADFPRSRLVAMDFVDAMVQLPELAPARTMLYTARPPSRFGEILVASLQEAGYDLRLGSLDGAIDGAIDGAGATLDYRITSEERDVWTFLVSAGGVRLKRTYAVDEAGVSPLSSMLLHGADVTSLESSPSLFGAPPRGRTPPPSAVPRSTVPQRASADPVARAADEAVDGAVDGAVAEAVASAVPLAPSGPRLPPTGPRLQKRNVFETRRSNYADVLDRYVTLSRDVMIFPNDSLSMGGVNKRLARAIAARVDPARDVVSVLGCSHGTTALANGNRTLANGRSYRVKEELMLAGIDADLVLEEGCWAGRAHETLPARGVVVTHKRRAVAG